MGQPEALDVGLGNSRVGQPRFPPGLAPQAGIRVSSPRAHAIGASTPLHMVRAGTISPIVLSLKAGVVLAGSSKVGSALLHPCHWG